MLVRTYLLLTRYLYSIFYLLLIKTFKVKVKSKHLHQKHDWCWRHLRRSIKSYNCLFILNSSMLIFTYWEEWARHPININSILTLILMSISFMPHRNPYSWIWVPVWLETDRAFLEYSTRIFDLIYCVGLTIFSIHVEKSTHHFLCHFTSPMTAMSMIKYFFAVLSTSDVLNCHKHA